ncbi:hypothetical protein Tco_0352110 [Tanacetum coccineum]
MRLFQFSLRSKACNWLERIPAGIQSPHDRILLLISLLNSFHREGQQNSEMTSWYSNNIMTKHIDQACPVEDSVGENAEESWALLEDLALYDNESWNDPRDFAKPVKAISLPQDVPSTFDRHLIKLKNQV